MILLKSLFSTLYKYCAGDPWVRKGGEEYDCGCYCCLFARILPSSLLYLAECVQQVLSVSCSLLWNIPRTYSNSLIRLVKRAQRFVGPLQSSYTPADCCDELWRCRQKGIFRQQPKNRFVSTTHNHTRQKTVLSRALVRTISNILLSNQKCQQRSVHHALIIIFWSIFSKWTFRASLHQMLKWQRLFHNCLSVIISACGFTGRKCKDVVIRGSNCNCGFGQANIGPKRHG